MNTPLDNPRHEHFAQLMAGGESATKAYVSSGYSEKGAAQSANRLLRNVKVRARVQELQKAVAERGVEKAAVDRAWVLGHLTENVRRAMQEMPVRDGKGNELGVYEYAGAVANRALELLGKELGMFRDRLEVEGQFDLAAAIIAGRRRVDAHCGPEELPQAERLALREPGAVAATEEHGRATVVPQPAGAGGGPVTAAEFEARLLMSRLADGGASE